MLHKEVYSMHIICTPLIHLIIKCVHCFSPRYQTIATMLHLNRQVYVFCI